MNGRAARKITGRTIITGRLVLETPAHLGNGDTVGVTDMPLLPRSTRRRDPAADRRLHRWRAACISA